MTKHIHGGDVYKYDHCLDFSANCNPLGTPQSVKQAIIDSVEDLSDYPRVGCGPLKEAIADYEYTKKEYLICGNGAADLIFSLSRALNPKKALLPAPTFAEYEQALVSVGCEISRYYLKEENDFCILFSCVIPIIPQGSPYLRTFWKKFWKPVPCREYLW